MGSHDATGGTVGGQVGYRWQAASWVFGVEAQGNWADFHGRNVIPFSVPSVTDDTRVDAFGLFTGQVGYAANNVLFYVKGGAAVTSHRYLSATHRYSPTTSMTPVGVAWSASAWNMASPRTGRPASNTITCSCRTRPIDLSSNGVIVPAGIEMAQSRIRQDVDIVTARINYKFSGY